MGVPAGMPRPRYMPMDGSGFITFGAGIVIPVEARILVIRVPV